MKKGFTLVELLLYVSITSILLLAASIFFSVLLQSRVKNQTIAEVEQQGLGAMQLITQTVRNATNINSPATSTSASLLSLNTVTALNNPTVFDLASSTLRITEGSGAAVPLVNSRVTVSGLTFQNLSLPATPGTIRIQFTISQANPASRSEYNFSKMFAGSASLR